MQLRFQLITAGDIVRVLENEIGLVQCIENPKTFERIETCPTRNLWEMATRAIYDQLNGVTLAELAQTGRDITSAGRPIMHTDIIMAHFTHPHNPSTMAYADGVGEVGNPPVCGDR